MSVPEDRKELKALIPAPSRGGIRMVPGGGLGTSFTPPLSLLTIKFSLIKHMSLKQPQLILPLDNYRRYLLDIVKRR